MTPAHLPLSFFQHHVQTQEEVSLTTVDALLCGVSFEAVLGNNDNYSRKVMGFQDHHEWFHNLSAAWPAPSRMMLIHEQSGTAADDIIQHLQVCLC